MAFTDCQLNKYIKDQSNQRNEEISWGHFEKIDLLAECPLWMIIYKTFYFLGGKEDYVFLSQRHRCRFQNKKCWTVRGSYQIC